MRKLILFLLLLAGLPDPEATASLSISMDDPPLEGELLTTEARFARIDSLTAVYDRAEDDERAAVAHRLGQLYLSTGLRKHKRLALDYLSEAIHATTDAAFSAGQLRARTAQDMRYTRDAGNWFRELTEIHPGDPRSHVQLGRFHFSEAKALVDDSRFARARQAYTAAIQVDSTHAPGWYGLSASLLVLESHRGATHAATKLLDHPDQALAGWMLRGAARVGLEEYEAAQRDFQRAFAVAPPEIRDVFVEGEGFLDEQHLEDAVKLGIDPHRLNAKMQEHQPGFGYGDEVDVELLLADEAIRDVAMGIFWDDHKTWPSSVVNRRRLEFWKRLVEADVLFGDPDSGVRGWTTEMGTAWARWGRPTFTLYEPPATSVDLADWQYRGIRLSPSTDIPTQTQLWVWTYRRDEAWFSLLFTDPTLQRKWKAEGVTVQAMLARAKVQPMLFYDGERSARFDLSLETATFARGATRRVEVFASVEPWDELVTRLLEGSRERVLMEWAIYDDDDERIEYRRRELGAGDLRATLAAALGADPVSSDRNDLMAQLVATLTPGHYRIGLDVSHPTLGHRGMVIYLEVPSSPPPGFVELSDLVLATHYAPFEPGAGMPPEYVKYALAALPTASRVFPVEADRLFVTFEAYNLSLDPTGRTHFNVRYRVYALPPGSDLAERGTHLDAAGLREIELSGLTFVEERTGIAPEGHVVKGGAVDLQGLPPGRYVLRVEVEDLVGEVTAERFVTFRRGPGS